MSGVDEYQGDDTRRQGSKAKGDKPDGPKSRTAGFKDNAQATYFVDEESKRELRALGEDLAIVCPLIDGRMHDAGTD
jgi:hypothetical protein